MRLTYTDLKSQFLAGTQNAGSTDATLLSYFQLALDGRYQLILAELDDHQNQKALTTTTAVNQQFYHYPAGIVNIESCTVQVGSIYYPVSVVNSQLAWDRLNELLISTTAIPQFIFPRRDDFGIWPIPQGVYNLVLNFHYRDRRLTQDDYTTGTVTVTNNSQTVTGSGTSWTSAMIGRWFCMNDGTQQGQGYWYRISAVASSTSLTIETSYEGVTVSGANYKIGESPELPEEAHRLLYVGAIADYMMEVRGDADSKGTKFNNIFWTGDPQNNDRTGLNVQGGLIGLKKRYATRSASAVVQRRAGNHQYDTKLWATTLSS